MHSLTIFIYIMSLVLDPVIFFSFLIRDFGMIKVSILLQMLLLFLLPFDILSRTKIVVPKPFNAPLAPILLVLCMVLISTLIGVFLGVLPNSQVIYNEHSLSLALEKSVLRETLIFLFQLFYYLYLPLYIFKSAASILLFFKLFFFVFFLHFIGGIIDLALNYFDLDFLGRFIVNDQTFAKFRFNGLAGEPRDAFAFNMVAISLVFARFWFDEKFVPNKTLICLIFVVAILTASTSGFFSITFALLLMFVFALPRLFVPKSSKDFTKFLLYTISVVLLTGTFLIFPRFLTHIDAIYGLSSGVVNQNFSALEGQQTNFYPLIGFLQNLKEFNLLKVAFGSGLGSSAQINAAMSQSGEALNPHAQISRLIYDLGALGSLTFVLCFMKIASLKSPCTTKRQESLLRIGGILVLGSFLGHRSDCFWVFFAAVVAMKNTKTLEKVMQSNRNFKSTSLK